MHSFVIIMFFNCVDFHYAQTYRDVEIKRSGKRFTQV